MTLGAGEMHHGCASPARIERQKPQTSTSDDKVAMLAIAVLALTKGAPQQTCSSPRLQEIVVAESPPPTVCHSPTLRYGEDEMNHSPEVATVAVALAVFQAGRRAVEDQWIWLC